MTTSSLKDQIKNDMIAAMRAKETGKLAVIRMLQAAIKQKEIDERIVLNDTDVLAVVEKMIKQRRESAKQFEQGNRPELAAKENQEIETLQAYMPQQLSDAELESLITDAIKQTGANEMKDMGKVMGVLKPQVQGRADMSQVSAKIKSLLA